MAHADYSESFSGSDATLVPPTTAETVETLRQVAGGVGTRLLRVEDARLLAGGGRFIADLALPGMLHMRLVRSSVAHGWIREISLPDLPPGTWAFRAADLGQPPPRVRALYQPRGQVMPDWPLLAIDKVRYVGEPIVAVLAPDPYQAEDLADQVDIDIEAIAPAVDPLDPSPSIIHDAYVGNFAFETNASVGTLEPRSGSVTVRRVFRSHRHTGVPMETRGCIASVQDGDLTMWASTQIPELLRLFLADILQWDLRRIHVSVPDVGGAFGVKGHAYPDEALVAALAVKTCCPVRWIEDRAENFLASIHARDEILDLALTVADDGEIIALEADVTIDSGAYPAWPQTSALEAQMAVSILPGPYRVPVYRGRARSVFTNKAPFGTYRGVARPGVVFALERLVDETARELGMDPVAFRARNLVTDFPYNTGTGLTYDAGSYRAALDAAARAVAGEPRVRLGAATEGQLLRGVGFACFVEQSAHVPPWARSESGVVAAPDRVSVALDGSGGLIVTAGLTSHGQGQETTLAQIVASRLGVPASAVIVAYGTTDSGMFSMGTLASRSAVVAGNACAMAADGLAEILRTAAAGEFGCQSAQVRLEDGWAVSGQARVPLAELALRYGTHSGREGLVLEFSAEYDGPTGGTFSNSCHAAVVAVDPATGHVEVCRYVVVEDCGRLINPLIVEGQIKGGVAQGIGSALYEELCYDESGQLLTTSFHDYRVPTSMEVPRIEITHLETPSANALGTKGMGESGAIGPMAAIANAVADALGPVGAALVSETPLTPPRVWAIIEKARSGCNR